MANQFLDASPEILHMLEQLLLFTCSKEEAGVVCGLPVKKEQDGSVIMPIPIIARVWPVKPNIQGKLKHRIIIQLPFTSQELPWLSQINGSRGPTSMAGADRISLWVNSEQTEEQAEGYSDDQSAGEDNW